jgi:hypothetical protein
MTCSLYIQGRFLENVAWISPVPEEAVKKYAYKQKSYNGVFYIDGGVQTSGRGDFH